MAQGRHGSAWRTLNARYQSIKKNYSPGEYYPRRCTQTRKQTAQQPLEQQFHPGKKISHLFKQHEL
jgi:hypothetical protein